MMVRHKEKCYYLLLFINTSFQHLVFFYYFYIIHHLHATCVKTSGGQCYVWHPPAQKNPQRIKTIVVTTITNDASAVSYDS